MKGRPARGAVLCKPFNSTYMPPLDSLTVLCGRPLVADCPRLASSHAGTADVTVVGQGEATTRSTKRLNVELPPVRLKKGGTKPHVFPFMKVEFAVRNSFPRPKPVPDQTSPDRTADRTADRETGYKKGIFVHTSSRSPLSEGLALLCAGRQHPGHHHRNAPRCHGDEPQRMRTETRAQWESGDTYRIQPGEDPAVCSPDPSPWPDEGPGPRTLSAPADDNWGPSLAGFPSENKAMGKNKAATKRHPLQYSARLPATLSSPIKTSQLGQAKALRSLASLSQAKSKARTPATAPPASRSQRASRPREKVEYAEYLPVSGPDDDLSDLDLVETMRSPTKKKERRNRKATNRDEDLPDPRRSSSSAFAYSKRGSLAYSDDSDDDKKSDISDVSDVSVSVINPDLPSLGLTGQQESRTSRMCQVLQSISSTGAPKRGTLKLDKDYEDEQRRQQLADQRRRKQQHVYNKLRSKSWHLARAKSDSNAAGHASFDNYDFLARYCILNPENTETYRHIFDQVDEQGRGWLSQEQTAVALKEVNGKLTGAEQQFLFRIMEVTGYSATDGADFRLFATLAALSQKISSLDSWMRLMVREVNFQLLEMKTFLCKRLWEVCVDPNTSYMDLDILMLELRSGGISHGHQEQVRRQLGRLTSLDLVDFLTYCPLFVHIHQTVIDNPLSDISIM
ncbi:hypothetical protein BsWGS_12644 [Bradybaena similaris]